MNTTLSRTKTTFLGGILGLEQFLAARSIARNVLWIAASAIGLMFGWLIPSLVQSVEPFGVTAGTLLYGVATAAALWWFAKQ